MLSHFLARNSPVTHSLVGSAENPAKIWEELNNINFLAVIEGRDFEHSLKKIVSMLFHALFNLSPMGIHRKGSELDDTRTNSLIFAHRVSRSFTSHP